MNIQKIATAISPTVVTPKKPAIWPNLSAMSPDIEVLSAAPTPERVPTRP
jgi:hypothetical protein